MLPHSILTCVMYALVYTHPHTLQWPMTCFFVGNCWQPSIWRSPSADIGPNIRLYHIHDQAAQEAVRSALLEMLFFIRKLNHKTMGSNTDLLHQGTEKEISKSVTDRMDAFMESSTASIELLWNGNIEKVFFPLTPMCRELDKNAKWKQELIGHLQSVPSECRSNPLQKAISLMHLMDVAAADLTAIGYLNQNFQWQVVLDAMQHMPETYSLLFCL